MDSTGWLRILYIANLRGQIDLLPRLYTLIRRLREDSIGMRVLLLDLGHSCDDSVWHCAVTQGRSMLIALDAMGCDAANVSGQLDSTGRHRLQDNFLNLGLVDETHLWNGGGITAALSEELIGPAAFAVLLRPSNATQLKGHALYLADILTGQVGDVTLHLAPERIEIVTSFTHNLPPNTLPDPTIAAAVDFILAEARRLLEYKHDSQIRGQQAP